jgi:hypothetical protein
MWCHVDWYTGTDDVKENSASICSVRHCIGCPYSHQWHSQALYWMSVQPSVTQSGIVLDVCTAISDTVRHCIGYPYSHQWHNQVLYWMSVQPSVTHVIIVLCWTTKIFSIIISINGKLRVASLNASSNHLFCQVALSLVLLMYLLSGMLLVHVDSYECWPTWEGFLCL